MGLTSSSCEKEKEPLVNDRTISCPGCLTERLRSKILITYTPEMHRQANEWWVFDTNPESVTACRRCGYARTTSEEELTREQYYYRFVKTN